MREVLFRGKRAGGGEWVFGSYIYAHKWGFDGSDGHLICNVYATARTQVNPQTVGQFTGRTDSNGIQIFEGDIVDGLILHNMPIRAVVAFQEGAFGLDWQRGEVRVFTAFTSYCNTVFKVIGNIHDNPELLEV